MCDLPEKIDSRCPHCQQLQIHITGVIAALSAPLPDIFSVKCLHCGKTGSAVQQETGWQIQWQ